MKYPFIIFNKNFKLKNIKKVFDNSIKNKPSTGIDGININCFEKKLDNELKTINRKVFNKTYNFSFYKEKLISKGKNKYPRVISLPTLRDKIVLKTIFNTLTEIYIDDLSNELIHSKVDKIKTTIQSGRFDSFIKMDIENFYPSIDHKKLLQTISRKTKKSEFIDLLTKAITQATVSKSNNSTEKYSSKIGVPQGLSISNILSSIYFIDFDKQHSTQLSYEYYRYVDDILILCNEADIKVIFETIKNDMTNLKLKVHELGISSQKTDYGSIKNSFYFLGYTYSDALISVRESSINKLHSSIIDIFTQYKHLKNKNIQFLYWKLNLKITGCKFEGKKYGWLYFFSQINDKTLLFKLDTFVNSMFKKFDIKYEKKEVKKFTRTYFEILKNRTNTTYIPDFTKLTRSEKKDILENVFNLHEISSSKIEYIFNKLIYKSIKEMEKDIQMY